jgi:hypothetical protein
MLEAPPWQSIEDLELIGRLAGQHAANEQARRERDVRGELASRLREWFAGELVRLDPVPGQRPDTVLGHRVGLPASGTLVSKRSGESMRFYGRTSEIRKERWGTKIRCALNCAEASPKKLRQAFAKMYDRTLRQMRNPDLKSAGYVLEPEVKGGMIDLVAIVTDETAARKIAERCYTGVLVSMDGDDVASVDLVDSPAGFLEKRSAIQSEVIVKLYDRGGDVNDWKRLEQVMKRNGIRPGAVLEEFAKTSARAGSPTPLFDAAWREWEERYQAYRDNPNAVTKAQCERAEADVRKATIAEAQRRPVAVGSDAMVAFLRHGRP